MRIRSFVVFESTPVYHHSTDGYVGQRSRPVSFCGTLAAALESTDQHYRMLGDTVEWDDAPSYSVSLCSPFCDNEGRTYWTPLRTYNYYDLETVNSYYTGPVDNSIPF